MFHAVLRQTPVLQASVMPEQSTRTPSMQVPATQVFNGWQLTHAFPPAPQREGVALVMQTPEAVQQPGQLLALQLVPPEQVPLLQLWPAP